MSLYTLPSTTKGRSPNEFISPTKPTIISRRAINFRFKLRILAFRAFPRGYRRWIRLQPTLPGRLSHHAVASLWASSSTARSSIQHVLPTRLAHCSFRPRRARTAPVTGPQSPHVPRRAMTSQFGIRPSLRPIGASLRVPAVASRPRVRPPILSSARRIPDIISPHVSVHQLLAMLFQSHPLSSDSTQNLRLPSLTLRTIRLRAWPDILTTHAITSTRSAPRSSDIAQLSLPLTNRSVARLLAASMLSRPYDSSVDSNAHSLRLRGPPADEEPQSSSIDHIADSVLRRSLRSSRTCALHVLYAIGVRDLHTQAITRRRYCTACT